MGTLINYNGNQLLATATGVGSERIFGLDGQLIFDACILALNIFILFTILSYVLFNPVRKMLQDRQDKITKEREDALTDRESASALKSEYENRLNHVEKEAELILSEARRKALQNEERIVQEARNEATRIIEHAREQAELEKKKVTDEVKKEIILVSSVLAGKMVAVSMDEETQNNLIQQTLGEMGDRTWLS